MTHLKEKIGLGILAAMLVTNPLTGQYINQFLDWGFTEMFRHGSWIGIVGTVYLAGLMGIYYFKSEKVNIPARTTKAKKSSKTDPMAYIET